MYSYVFSFKLIDKISKNPDGAKRTRTADPLHAMQVPNQAITRFLACFY